METIIKPQKGISFLDFKELWQQRDLFYFFAWRDIKLRYKQTILGVIWAVLQPFILMIVFSVIFGRIARVPSDGIPYPVFSYAGLLLWNIFSNSLNNSSQSLLASASIIQKIYLPKIIIPVASMIVTLVDFVPSFIIFLGIIIYYKFTPHLLGLLLVPIFVFLTFVSSLGLGLFLSAFNVKYRDVRYALPFFIQILIFVTPIIYPVSIIPPKYQWVLALNPMAGIIGTFKALFFGGAAVNLLMMIISFASGFLLLLFGVCYFLKTEKHFADII